MDYIIFIYFLLSAIFVPPFIMDLYKTNCKEHTALWEEDLTYCEFVTLGLLGVLFGTIILPFILMYGIFQIFIGLKRKER